MTKEKLVPRLRFKGFISKWGLIQINDIFTLTRGNVLSAKKITQVPTETMRYPVYSSQTQRNGLMGYYDKYLYQNAITWTTDGANAGTVNFRSGKFYCTNVCGVLLSNQGYANRMISEALNKIAWKHVSKVGNPKLMNNIMAEIEIYIPSLKEQNKIASFFKKIDQMIQLQQSKVNKVKDIKAAYLSEMFPKAGEKYPKKRFEGFTEAWSLTKFSDIADVQRGLTYHPSNIVEDGGVRVLRSSNIDEDKFITRDDDVFVNEGAININFAQEQDILITSANGSPRLVGKHAILDKLKTRSVHGGFMLLARTDNPHFLNASMSSDWYRKFINYHVAGGGGSIGNIKKSDLENQLIYIPSKEEQSKIGKFFKNLDNQISLEEEKLSKLEKLKQAYLNDMFV